MKKYGFSFSWKRALGISAANSRLSRQIGIPLTRSGRQRKVGRAWLLRGNRGAGRAARATDNSRHLYAIAAVSVLALGIAIFALVR